MKKFVVDEAGRLRDGEFSYVSESGEFLVTVLVENGQKKAERIERIKKE